MDNNWDINVAEWTWRDSTHNNFSKVDFISPLNGMTVEWVGV